MLIKDYGLDTHELILLNLVKRDPWIQNRHEIAHENNCDGEKNYVVKEFDHNYNVIHHGMKFIIRLL